MKTWLLVDATFMVHRARHSTGGLSHGGMSTGVTFGVLRDLEKISELHQADRVILAFDYGGQGHRAQILPSYKGSRRNQELTDEERKELEDFYAEVDRLKSKTLPEAGYRNILCVKGFEADDIIASIAEDIPTGVEAVIVSADNDLLQCLSDRVIFYNPITKKATTSESFKEEWGLLPAMWASVKALAGCSTDDIPGIRGIGEVTAAKWFNGKLKQDSQAYKKINENLDVFHRNMPLVRLPFPGLELPSLRDDEVTDASLSKVRTDLGIKSRRSAPRMVEPGFEGFDL